MQKTKYYTPNLVAYTGSSELGRVYFGIIRDNQGIYRAKRCIATHNGKGAIFLPEGENPYSGLGTTIREAIWKACGCNVKNIKRLQTQIIPEAFLTN